jgi:hypothetical protein
MNERLEDNYKVSRLIIRLLVRRLRRAQRAQRQDECFFSRVATAHHLQ